MLLPLFFLTPITYSLDNLPGLDGHPWLVDLIEWGNPLTPVVQCFRTPLFEGEVPSAANLVYLLLLVAGAVVVPLSSYPVGLRDVATLLPSGALAEGLRESLNGGTVDPTRMLVLLVWAVVAALLTVRWFRWE